MTADLEANVLAALKARPDTVPGLVERPGIELDTMRAACESLLEAGYLTKQPRGYFVVYTTTEAGRDRVGEP